MVRYFSHLERLLFFPCIFSALYFSHVYWNVLWLSKSILNLEPDFGLLALDLDPQANLTHAWANFRPVSWVLVFLRFSVVADNKEFVSRNYSEHLQIFNASLNVKSLFSTQLMCSPLFLFLFTEISKRAVQFSCSTVSNSLWPHGPQHVRTPCPSPAPRAYSNSCPLSRWCHPTISSSVTPFSSRLRSFPASGSFPVSQLFLSGDQSKCATVFHFIAVCFLSRLLALFLLLPSPLSSKLTIYI